MRQRIQFIMKLRQVIQLLLIDAVSQLALQLVIEHNGYVILEVQIKIYTQTGGGNFTVDNFTCYEATVNPNLNATGICNQANSCTTLTATANNAIILQQFTMASAARSFSAYLKRKTGTGTISITRDGGSNWTDVTSQINSSTFTRVSILNTSVTNPNCGFKFGTSGDEIIVDCCQDEAGVNASTPIITTTATVTRNADVLTYPVANVHATKNTVYHEAAASDTIAVDRRSFAVSASTNNRAQWLCHPGGLDKNLARYGTGSTTVATGALNNTITNLTKSIMRCYYSSTIHSCKCSTFILRLCEKEDRDRYYLYHS